MASYSLDPIAANCYPNTTVLINKFDIRDEAKLLELEIAITQEAAARWELSPGYNSLILSTTRRFISEFVDLYIATNYLHPFREGNGRTQRLFLAQLVRSAGYSLDFADIDVDELMIATIQSSGGVDDGLRRIFTQAIR